MYVVLSCQKCGHQLYVEETPTLGEKLGSVSVMPCPECGEEGYDNWALSGRKREFPKEDAENEES